MISKGTPIDSYFNQEFSFEPMFKSLYPRQMVSSEHGLDLAWEVQLIVDDFVDQELHGDPDARSGGILRSMKPKPRQPDSFNDFLSLANPTFEKERLLVFHGTSGSGNSANLKFLADHHPQFVAQETPWLWTMGKNFDPSGVRGHRLVAVDEIISPFQFPGLLKLLKTNARKGAESFSTAITIA